MSEPIYSRAPVVVWRLGPDRVLVRRVGAGGENSAVDLLGDAALVWIALDEPASVDEVSDRIAAHRTPSCRVAVDQLVAGGWITPTELAPRSVEPDQGHVLGS